MGAKTLLKNFIYDPSGALEHFLSRHLPGVVIGDRMHLKRIYKKRLGIRLNLKKPVRFTEKMQWIKLYDRNPLYTRLADKYEVRGYISNIVGEEYLIPLIGVWDKFEDIGFSDLPEQFVLKSTHDSRGVIICKNKSDFNISKAKEFFEDRYETNHYWLYREYCYKHIKPRLICEEYKVDEGGVELKDYKVYCFNGVPKYILLIYNRFTELIKNVYDTEWNFLPVSIHGPYDSNAVFDKPVLLEEMLDVASKLSKDIPFIRVDFYIADNRLYVGELTLYPSGGYAKFKPQEYDFIFGECLTLPPKRRKHKKC